MSLVTGYSSSEDESDSPAQPSFQSVKVVAAPQVKDAPKKELTISTIDDNNNGQLQKTITGHIERENFDETTFEIQRRNFDNLGYAKSLYGNNTVIGDQSMAHRLNKRDITDLKPSKEDKKRIKSKRFKRGKSDKIDGDGAYAGPWAKYHDSSSSEDEVHPEEAGSESEKEKEEQEQIKTDSEEEEETGSQDSTEFYGTSEKDYQGRTYMHIPKDVGVNLTNDDVPEECFIPKRQIHVWKGHTNGTNKIVLFPKSNHLLLSCGNDSKIYLWSVYHKRELLRGFFGHNKPIKDIAFNNDGTRVISTSYDHFIKVWDTETGKCLEKFRTKSVGNTIKFNPFNDDEFIVGLMNSKIDHYSIKEKKIIQSYDHHLGSINSITFLENKRFISTSEDKTVRVWDLQINIPIKLISDPTLHSMPVTKIHPQGKYFAAQSMDNTIMVFSTKDRYKTNKKKLFTGHNCAGYGIGIDFSPDGKDIVSGDSNGNAVFWDWKTTKLIKKLKIDDKAITQVLWNTKEVSKVIFTGSSGKIYYYE
ncbi:putative WD repeat-containing protein [Wickerhamomyces ciferrii]|uniref:Pre-mRNA-processing factor 17 n=1 Tax=Wickerhamomyces ciferrii (strain ATCC 14091 / BCRC 22168 / CBS 111 / JCM 3599 / NBRC 0793 / NRRL Y-1031 F-60-10) TaxID=1206466 RepID=K0KJQ5_WICCF|nr:putative WD repeat-containing protein [Wickerhamomyces ciferrii]CCH45495.1 putative WD repeat-containing protein [Wickerhamomyces ciferrii]